jgi:hypothetical protein
MFIHVVVVAHPTEANQFLTAEALTVFKYGAIGI